MFLLILLAAVAVTAIAATVRAWITDDYRAVPTDPRRLP